MTSVAVLLFSEKLGLIRMILSKKFAIVELERVSKPDQNPYKIVPKTWLKFRGLDDVILPYPTAEELPLSLDLIINYAAPSLRWPSHAATFICELGK